MVVLDAITQVELFLNVFVGVYVLVIFVYVLTSWIQLPYSLRPVQRFLFDVCEPYLRLWRRVLPSMGPLDLSPMVAVIGLIVAERIVIAILDRLD
ncbi:MAG TPA: YggT family protein [Gaiellaceae bacterium]|nr:YggT family protein [Gaiellaceae bacterium]